MKKFLSTHKNIAWLLNFTVFALILFAVVKIFGSFGDFTSSIKAPFALNLFCLLILTYIQFVNSGSFKKFKSLGDWARPFLFANSITLVSLLTIGIYSRVGRKVASPLWTLEFGKAIKVIAVYLLFIVVSATIITVSKRRKR